MIKITQQLLNNMPRQKTRAEKIQSGYRLQNFKLHAAEKAVEKDREEFGYLSSRYVIGDLLKTLIFTIVILGILAFAKLRLG